MPKNRVRIFREGRRMSAVLRFFTKNSPVHRRLRTWGLPLDHSLALRPRNTDIYMEAIKWDNAATLYEGYSKQA
jgi:hypothetical protein